MLFPIIYQIVKNLSVRDWIVDVAYQLQSISETPLLDAQLIFCFCTGYSRAHLLLQWDKALSQDLNISAQLHLLVSMRIKGWPIAYLIGKKDFGTLSFHVCKGLLIPRPETECFIDIFLNKYENTTAFSLRDIGTGTGCLALSLAFHFPKWQITASDISRISQKIFAKNQHVLQIPNAIFLRKPFLRGGSQFYDIVIANLPYLTPKETYHKKHREYWKEPALALNGRGKDGLKLIKKLLRQAKNRCKSVYLEADPTQMHILEKYLLKNNFTEIKIYQDLSGKNRIISGKTILNSQQKFNTS